jgi:hypothetical protein
MALIYTNKEKDRLFIFKKRSTDLIQLVVFEGMW